MRQIILAAGSGSRLAPLTDDRPKCMVELAGVPLIERQIAAARQSGIDDFVIVGGYRAEQLPHDKATVVINDAYRTTNMVRSLFRAERYFSDGFIMAYGDIVYSSDVMRRLLAAEDDIAVVIDRGWRSYWQERFDDPLDDAETLRIGDDGNLAEIGQKPSSLDDIEGQYIGLVKFSPDGVSRLREAYRQADAEDREGRHPFGGARSLDSLYMTDLLQGMIDAGTALRPTFIDGGWAEIDTPEDLAVAAGRLDTLT